MDLTYDMVPIRQLCDIERAVNGKIYPKGTCYFKLLAVDDDVDQLEACGEIESRYCAMIPHDGIDHDYLYLCVCKEFPVFLRRYRTTINLQFNAFDHFLIPWHRDPATRAYASKAIRMVDDEIKRVNAMIKEEKELKKWYLEKMMAQ